MCVIPFGNELLLQKVELSPGMKPCSPVWLHHSPGHRLTGEDSCFLHALFKDSSPILNCFGEMPGTVILEGRNLGRSRSSAGCSRARLTCSGTQ